jgi:hypothetical protein
MLVKNIQVLGVRDWNGSNKNTLEIFLKLKIVSLIRGLRDFWIL